jgi:hypothetical protein
VSVVAVLVLCFSFALPPFSSLHFSGFLHPLVRGTRPLIVFFFLYLPTRAASETIAGVLFSFNVIVASPFLFYFTFSYFTLVDITMNGGKQLQPLTQHQYSFGNCLLFFVVCMAVINSYAGWS